MATTEQIDLMQKEITGIAGKLWWTNDGINSLVELNKTLVEQNAKLIELLTAGGIKAPTEKKAKGKATKKEKKSEDTEDAEISWSISGHELKDGTVIEDSFLVKISTPKPKFKKFVKELEGVWSAKARGFTFSTKVTTFDHVLDEIKKEFPDWPVTVKRPKNISTDDDDDSEAVAQLEAAAAEVSDNDDDDEDDDDDDDEDEDITDNW